MSLTTNDPDRLTARVAELEVRLTLQQDELDKLSEVLYRQQRELDGLLLRLQLLEARRPADPQPAPRDPADEVPPHY